MADVTWHERVMQAMWDDATEKQRTDLFDQHHRAKGHGQITLKDTAAAASHFKQFVNSHPQYKSTIYDTLDLSDLYRYSTAELEHMLSRASYTANKRIVRLGEEYATSNRVKAGVEFTQRAETDVGKLNFGVRHVNRLLKEQMAAGKITADEYASAYRRAVRNELKDVRIFLTGSVQVEETAKLSELASDTTKRGIVREQRKIMMGILSTIGQNWSLRDVDKFRKTLGNRPAFGEMWASIKRDISRYGDDSIYANLSSTEQVERYLQYTTGGQPMKRRLKEFLEQKEADDPKFKWKIAPGGLLVQNEITKKWSRKSAMPVLGEFLDSDLIDRLSGYSAADEIQARTGIDISERQPSLVINDNGKIIGRQNPWKSNPEEIAQIFEELGWND